MCPLNTEASGIETTNKVLEIKDIELITFQGLSGTERDNEGHAHPTEEHVVNEYLFEITSIDGQSGYSFPRKSMEDAFPLLEDFLLGEDALSREKIWQKMYRSQRVNSVELNDYTMAAVDIALWDLAGRHYNLPISKLLGSNREEVPAYASTFNGDEKRGLDTPEKYADFAEECLDEGYQAFKLHTWFPPVNFGDQDPERDIAACRAVRERVGDEMELMLDCSPHYSRFEARQIGKALEELDFLWYEEMMHEHAIDAYKWLTDELDVLICGPEMAQGEGKMGLRAEWIRDQACDIIRTGVWDVGGITPVMKTVHLAESFGIPLELHGGGAAHLQVLGAMGIPGRYYERSLMHPEYDYDKYSSNPVYLNEPIDPVDSDGMVPIPQRPGLGYDINWNYIEENKMGSE